MVSKYSNTSYKSDPRYYEFKEPFCHHQIVTKHQIIRWQVCTSGLMRRRSLIKMDGLIHKKTPPPFPLTLGLQKRLCGVIWGYKGRLKINFNQFYQSFTVFYCHRYLHNYVNCVATEKILIDKYLRQKPSQGQDNGGGRVAHSYLLHWQSLNVPQFINAVDIINHPTRSPNPSTNYPTRYDEIVVTL